MFILRKVLKCSSNYRRAFIHIIAFMNTLKSSIEVHLLNVRSIALFKHECANGAQKRERLLITKVGFRLHISQRTKNFTI